MKGLLALALLVTGTAHAVNFLSCSSNTYNPTFLMKIQKDSGTSLIRMNLARRMTGFVPTPNDVTNLGTDNVEVALNPSSCTIELKSVNHPRSEFRLHLSLAEDHWENKIYGSVSGSITGASTVTCSMVQSDFVDALRDVCRRASSHDGQFVFHRTTDVIQLLANLSSVDDSEIGGDGKVIDERGGWVLPKAVQQ